MTSVGLVCLFHSSVFLSSFVSTAFGFQVQCQWILTEFSKRLWNGKWCCLPHTFSTSLLSVALCVLLSPAFTLFSLSYFLLLSAIHCVQCFIINSHDCADWALKNSINVTLSVDLFSVQICLYTFVFQEQEKLKGPGFKGKVFQKSLLSLMCNIL